MRDAIISGILCLTISLAVVHSASAQDGAFVAVETNYPDAVIFADSLRLGGAYGEVLHVPASVRTIRLVPPDVDTWSVAPVSRTVHLTAGDTTRLEVNFPYSYRIETVPFGASVHIESDTGDLRRIGTTPTLYTTGEPISGSLLLQRAGYVTERIEPGRDVWNRYVVELSPSDQLDPTAAQVEWTPPSRHRAWIDYAALGVAVAAGAVAIHYKFRADDLYAEYEETADPTLRNDVKRLDVRSGVAFGVMQAGIGVFAIRLALR